MVTGKLQKERSEGHEVLTLQSDVISSEKMKREVRSPIEAKIAHRDFECGILMEDDYRRTPQSPLKDGNIDSNAKFSPYLTPKIIDRNFILDCDT